MDARQQLACEFRGRGLLWRVTGIVACCRVYGRVYGVLGCQGRGAKGEVSGARWPKARCQGDASGAAVHRDL